MVALLRFCFSEANLKAKFSEIILLLKDCLVANFNKARAPTSRKYVAEEGIVRPLTLILNQSFEKNLFPDVLKTAQVSPIQQIEDTATFSNYCPISLLSVLSKIFVQLNSCKNYVL